MPQEHTHEGSAAHSHSDDAPGHTHDTAPPATTTAAVDVGPTAGGLSARIVLTLLGAGLMIVSAFLTWFTAPAEFGGASASGTELSWSIFYDPGNPFEPSFFTSAGFVAIVLGVLALLGLALRTGWLTRLAGALGIVAIVLFAITLYRVEGADLSIGEIGIGAWLLLVGGLIVLVAGFLGSRRVVSANVPAA